MRKLFCILSVTLGLFANYGHALTDTTKAVLSFYVVSEEKIDGGRLIDTLDLPKLGYIAAKPDLVITQLVAVSQTVVADGGIYDKDGKQIGRPGPDRAALDIMIRSEDSRKFEALTKENIGKRVLMMLGDVPLIAPIVQSPISTQSFQVIIGKHGDPKKIEDGLKKLVP